MDNELNLIHSIENINSSFFLF